jgi:hypothetical protein
MTRRTSEIVGLIIVAGQMFLAAPTPAQTSEVTDLKHLLPSDVNLLREFSERSSPTDKSNVSDAQSKWIRRARNGAAEWVLKTIDKDSLPPDVNNLKVGMVLTQNAFGPNDVACVQWQKNGYVLQVAQTATIMLVRMRPISPSSQPATSIETKRSLAANTAERLFRKEARIRDVETGTGKVIEKQIMPELLKRCFEDAHIQAYDNGVHGRRRAPTNPADLTFEYWWRCVNWWTDGNSVAFYTLKTEGGPWEASYNSGLDATWFEGPPPASKR